MRLSPERGAVPNQPETRHPADMEQPAVVRVTRGPVYMRRGWKVEPGGRRALFVSLPLTSGFRIPQTSGFRRPKRRNLLTKLLFGVNQIPEFDESSSRKRGDRVRLGIRKSLREHRLQRSPKESALRREFVSGSSPFSSGIRPPTG